MTMVATCAPATVALRRRATNHMRLIWDLQGLRICDCMVAPTRGSGQGGNWERSGRRFVLELCYEVPDATLWDGWPTFSVWFWTAGPGFRLVFRCLNIRRVPHPLGCAQ